MADFQRPLQRSTLALTLAALVALPAPAALAQADTPDPGGAALQAERYYSSYGEPAGGDRAALATERYLSSYGTPQATTSSSTVTADAGPTWTAAIIVGTLLAVISAGVGVLAGRASARPRHVTA